MNGVERSQRRRLEFRGQVVQRVVEVSQRQRRANLTRARDRTGIGET
jgi:hypothetical protein